jgi:exodeoxyribonuclease VII small subunit
MKKINEAIEKKVVKLNFEKAMERLEEVVEKLSDGNISLDEMIELYQEGEALKRHCQSRLDEAKMKIEEVN